MAFAATLLFPLPKLSCVAARKGLIGKWNLFTFINLFLPPIEPMAAWVVQLIEDLVKIMDQIESTQEIAC